MPLSRVDLTLNIISTFINQTVQFLQIRAAAAISRNKITQCGQGCFIMRMKVQPNTCHTAVYSQKLGSLDYICVADSMGLSSFKF